MGIDEKVYEAENEVFKNERTYTETQIKKFFFLITGDNWFINKYGTGYKMYSIGPNFFDASYGCYKEIYLLENEHFTQSTVCHELMHACKHIRRNPHGKAWQKRYVDMVKIYISNQMGEELEQRFSKIYENNKKNYLALENRKKV